MSHCGEKSLTGTYVLVIYLQKRKKIGIGRLGTFSFHRGYYLYIGSAFGPGGLNSRIRRHLQRTKKHHWHIDYLAAAATIKEVWFSSNSDKYECRWTNILKGISELQLLVPDFGSSDCSCHSHLFYSKKRPLVTYYRDLLGSGLNSKNI